MEVPVTLQMNCGNPNGNINTTRKSERPHKSYVVTLAAPLHLPAVSFQTGEMDGCCSLTHFWGQASPKAQTVLLSLLGGTAVFRGNNSLLCAKPAFGGVSGLLSVLLFLGL